MHIFITKYEGNNGKYSVICNFECSYNQVLNVEKLVVIQNEKVNMVPYLTSTYLTTSFIIVNLGVTHVFIFTFQCTCTPFCIWPLYGNLQNRAQCIAEAYQYTVHNNMWFVSSCNSPYLCLC